MHDDVLRFDVPVDDLGVVEYFYCWAYLLHEGGYFNLGHRFSAFELLVELSTHANLQDDVDVLFIVKTAVHLDDVGVVEKHLYFDFSDELFYDLLLDQHCFFDDFQSTKEPTEFLPM
jgi:hypothetical protein